MGFGILGLAIGIIILIALLNIIKFGLRIIFFIILFVVLGVTVWVCTSTPDMHKPFSVETIEYLMKFNKDGSVTTTKQVTQTVIKEQE